MKSAVSCAIGSCQIWEARKYLMGEVFSQSGSFSVTRPFQLDVLLGEDAKETFTELGFTGSFKEGHDAYHWGEDGAQGLVPPLLSRVVIRANEQGKFIWKSAQRASGWTIMPYDELSARLK